MAGVTMTPEAWGERYAQQRGLFSDFEAEIRRVCDHVIADEGLDVFRVASRTKSVESFVDKIRRKGDKYADPLSEITDLAALRVIAYFPADVAQIGALVERHFAIDPVNSRRQTGAVDPDRFGYRSDHYVVSLSPERLSLPECRRFAGLRAEIQVRTVMQHAWAAVDHRFRYKKSDLPEELQRRLYRLSALLEVADEQFAAIKEAGDALETSYAAEVERGDLSAGIHVLSLEVYLEVTGVGADWARRAAAIGYAAGVADPESASRLAHVLHARGIRSLQAFEAFLAEVDGWADEYLRDVLRAVGVAFAIPADVLTFLAVRDAPPEVIGQLGFRPDITAALHQLNRSSGR